jgi:hypothetical protein
MDPHALGQRGELFALRDIEFDNWRRPRQPAGCILDHMQAAVACEHDLRALFLRELCDRECDRCMVDNASDKQTPAFEQAAHDRAP